MIIVTTMIVVTVVTTMIVMTVVITGSQGRAEREERQTDRQGNRENAGRTRTSIHRTPPVSAARASGVPVRRSMSARA
jgi:hypothetical protein